MAINGQPNHIISDDYFDEKQFPQNCTNNIIFQMYVYSEKGVFFSTDLSHKVIDYTYECSCDNNIRQTASVTIKVDTDDYECYLRRENKQYEWSDGCSIFGYTSNAQIAYRLIKTYHCTDNNETKQLDLGYFLPISTDYSYNSTTGTLTIGLQGLSTLLTKEYGGTVVTTRIGTTIIDPITHQEVIKMYPMTVAIAEGTDIDGQMFFSLAMGSYRDDSGWLNVTSQIPLAGASVGNGQILQHIPYDIEYDADVSRMDIMQEIINTAFEGAVLWVDENRYLQVSSKPEKRGNLVAHWRDYSHLFISENVTYNDSDYYNVTEVYGRDNGIYAICDMSHIDGSFAGRVRAQVLKFDELLTNEECQARADWETYKSRFGRMSITVTLVDRYIPQFKTPSLKVGKTIEYTTVDGDTNLYFLNKLSYSSNVWTMELSIFKPLYNTAEIRYNYTLTKPIITGHTVINNNTLRLYIESDDIQYGAVKIYVNSVGIPKFVGMSVKSDNDKNCKYADIPINHNGTYYCYASLYSPWYEDSPICGIADLCPYQAEVTEIVIPAITEDSDPYPHPNIFEPEGKHEPWLRTHNNKPLTTDSGENLTI